MICARYSQCACDYGQVTVAVVVQGHTAPRVISHTGEVFCRRVIVIGQGTLSLCCFYQPALRIVRERNHVAFGVFLLQEETLVVEGVDHLIESGNDVCSTHLGKLRSDACVRTVCTVTIVKERQARATYCL